MAVLTHVNNDVVRIKMMLMQYQQQLLLHQQIVVNGTNLLHQQELQ